jgi:hypothetical protein
MLPVDPMFKEDTPIAKILSVFSASLFVILVMMLCYYNRFAVDDYFHIHTVSQKGITGAMLEGYNTFGGRWTSYFLWNIVYSFYKIPVITALYSFLVFLLFGFAFHNLFKNILKTSNISTSKTFNYIYTFLFFSLFFLASFGKGEIWFWIVSTAMYLNSLTAFVFLLSLFLSSKNNIITYFFSILFSIFIGGAAETYAVLFLTSIALFTIIKLFSGNKIISTISYGKLITAFVFMGAAFAVSVAAPGNTIRTGWLPERSFMETFYTTLKALAKLFLFKIPPQLPFIILFSIPWIAFGEKIQKNAQSIELKKYFKTLVLSGILLTVILYIVMFPACYLLSEPGPDRSLSLVILLITLYAATVAIFTGYYSVISKKITKALQLISLAVISGVLLFTLISQFITVSEYSKALDKRIVYLQNIQNKDPHHVEYVKALPSSGFLYSAEISNDTAYFSNEQFRLGIFVDFKIACDQK